MTTRRKLPAMRGMLLVGVLVAVLAVGCGGSREAHQRALDTLSARTPTPQTSRDVLTTTAPSPVPIMCHPAPEKLVQMIDLAFTGGEELIHPTSVNGPQDATYIAGDITQAGEIVSHADVWLSRNGALFALSSDARKRTMLADGRDLASAGDEYGTAAQGCIGR